MPAWKSAGRGKRASRPTWPSSSDAKPASSSERPAHDSQPYIQHRGGPPGFLKVLDDKTIGFADYAGNRQYITLGNLADNPKAMIFLIDFRVRQRVKIWGEARVIEDDPGLIKRLKPDGYRARAEQAILFTVSAWTQTVRSTFRSASKRRRSTTMLADRDRRIEALTKELNQLRK